MKQQRNSSVIPVLYYLLFTLISFNVFAVHATDLKLESIRKKPSQFKSLLETYQKNCPALNCAHSTLKFESASLEQLKYENSALVEKFNRIVSDRAQQTWPDTVLEGGIETHFQTKLASVAIIKNEGKVIGYMLHFGALAWDVETCLFDPKDKETLKNCRKGTITESFFISENLEESLIYRMGLANFNG